MNPNDTDELLRRLSEATSPEAMRQIAVELSKPGLTARASRHPSFEQALKRLLAWIRDGAEEERLHALSILSRFRKQQNRPYPSEFEAALAEPIRPMLAEPSVLDDPRERDYLAQGLALVNFPGQAAYLARFVASEGQSRTDARSTAALVLLHRSTSLASTFDELATALRDQTHDTQDAATSRARRLLRVLEAVATALRDVDPPVTAETGASYSKLLADNLSSGVDRAVAIEATNLALTLLTAWVRPNFSVALVPETFRAIQELRRLFLPARWPDETREARATVGKSLRESISLLAQAGVTDDKLRESLILATDEHAAGSILRTLAKEAPALSNNVRYWLETGRASTASAESAAVSESVLETLDRDLAEVFRDSYAAMKGLSNLGGDLDEAVEIANPSLADAWRDQLSRWNRVARRIEAVAAKRGFELQGEVGAAVEYSPNDHTADHPVAGARVVRLVSPLVIRRSAGARLD